MNPSGFRQSQTSRKRRFQKGTPSVSPYESMAAAVYQEDAVDVCKRGSAKRALRVATAKLVTEHRPAKYMNSSAWRPLEMKAA